MTASDDSPEATRDARLTASLGDGTPCARGTFDEGSLVDETYLVRRRLGEGGNGLVLEAERVPLGDVVALKVLRRASAEAARRLSREARCLAALRSPNVARVYAVGTVDEGPYVVLEKLEGESLAHILARRGKIPFREAVGWAIEAARGLGDAHAAGIVHRDVKPSNLFLSREGEATVVKVIDFGIAAARDEERDDDGDVTRTGAVLGSPLYMAPEQIRHAREVDARADVWSLGVTIYELLTGVPPFRGSTHAAVLASVIGDTPLPPRSQIPELPVDLDALVLRCLSKDREERPTSMREVAEALARVGRPTVRVAAARRWASSLLGILALGLVTSWVALRPADKPASDVPPAPCALPPAEAPPSMVPPTSAPSVAHPKEVSPTPAKVALPSRTASPARASASPPAPNVTGAISERK